VTELAPREHVGRPAFACARAGIVVGVGGEIHDRRTVAPLDEVFEPLEAATALHFLIEQHGIVGGPGESGLQATAGRGLVFGRKRVPPLERDVVREQLPEIRAVADDQDLESHRAIRRRRRP
jgi:hypothetical protein